MKLHYCFVIPNYNHTQAVAETIEALQQYSIPIILIDDGSDFETQTLLEKLAAQYQNSPYL